MAVTEHDTGTTVPGEGRGSFALWFGVLGSPLAWLGHLFLNYSLEEWFACAPATTDRGEILGFGVRDVSLVLNTAMALVAAASGLVALATWRRLRRVSDGDSLDRAQWMAFAGTVEGALFLGMILLGYLPPVILRTCATGA
ncbi:MAG TPA: hypothetical protein VH479_19920 [Acidimicrobiales bacterium]|jgi:hypothetical protein